MDIHHLKYALQVIVKVKLFASGTAQNSMVSVILESQFVQ